MHNVTLSEQRARDRQKLSFTEFSKVEIWINSEHVSIQTCSRKCVIRSGVYKIKAYSMDKAELYRSSNLKECNADMAI